MQSWSSPLVLQNYFLCLIARNIASRASSQTIKVPLQFFFLDVQLTYIPENHPKYFRKITSLSPNQLTPPKIFAQKKKRLLKCFNVLSASDQLSPELAGRSRTINSTIGGSRFVVRQKSPNCPIRTVSTQDEILNKFSFTKISDKRQ